MPARRGLSVIVLAALLAPGPGLAEPAALKADRACKRPKVEAKVDFPREPVAYDLETHPEYEKAGRPLGLFSASHRLNYDGEVKEGCVQAVTVTIAVEPQIHLRSIYQKKIKKCARQLVLDHEKGHGRVARTEYKKLASEIKKRVPKLFTGKRVPDTSAVQAHLNDLFENDIGPRFQKRYEAAQDKFHGKLAQAEIVKKKCRLVKRKR